MDSQSSSSSSSSNSSSSISGVGARSSNYMRMSGTAAPSYAGRFRVHEDTPTSGKCAWLAPELLGSDHADSTRATDIYALGMTIWEVFSNKDPFEDEGASDPMQLDHDLVRRILDEDLRPSIPSSMPVGVAKLVGACWQKVRLEVLLHGVGDATDNGKLFRFRLS